MKPLTGNGGIRSVAMYEMNRNSGHSIIYHMLKPSKSLCPLIFPKGFLYSSLSRTRWQIIFERHSHDFHSTRSENQISFDGKTNFLPSSCSRYVALHSSCLLNPDVKFIHRSSSSLCELRIILLY